MPSPFISQLSALARTWIFRNSPLGRFYVSEIIVGRNSDRDVQTPGIEHHGCILPEHAVRQQLNLTVETEWRHRTRYASCKVVKLVSSSKSDFFRAHDFGNRRQIQHSVARYYREQVLSYGLLRIARA